MASINGTLSVEDGMRLDQRLDQIVESLRFLGDERPYGMLRSIAAGILAEPDSLFTLFDQVDHARGTEPESDSQPEPKLADDEQTEHAAPSDKAERSADKPDPHTDGRPVPAAFRRRTRLPATTLFMHFDRTWGTYSLDGIGAITRSEAQEVLGHSKVTVRPVIDLRVDDHRHRVRRVTAVEGADLAVQRRHLHVPVV